MDLILEDMEGCGGHQLLNDIEYFMSMWVNGNAQVVSAEQLGLDPRAGYSLCVVNDAIFVQAYVAGSLEYYGGFEYIPAECKKAIGDWKIYLTSGEDGCRVQECLDRLQENK